MLNEIYKYRIIGFVTTFVLLLSVLGVHVEMFSKKRYYRTYVSNSNSITSNNLSYTFIARVLYALRIQLCDIICYI